IEACEEWESDPDDATLEIRYLIIKVHCPFCDVYHSHAISPRLDARDACHVLAGCYRRTPFSETGYFISPWSSKGSPEGAGHKFKPNLAELIRKKQIETPGVQQLSE